MKWSWLFQNALTITIVVIVGSSFLNLFLGEAVFTEGINFIIDKQKKTTGFINFVQNSIIFLCDHLFVIGIVIFLYVIARRKLTILVFAFFVLSVLYINTISRNLFRSPRPFWTTTSIYNL